jgi:hypothetical protein
MKTKSMRELYKELGGLPVIKMDPPRFRDVSFQAYGRTVPRVLKYKWRT